VVYDPDSAAIVICPNTGDLTFYAAYRCTVLEGWVLVELADLKGDCHHELVWRNRSTGEVFAWYLANFRPSRGVNLGTPSLNWRLRGIGKFNANPSDAFVWHNSRSGRVASGILIAPGNSGLQTLEQRLIRGKSTVLAIPRSSATTRIRLSLRFGL
jgi:hypothetical protein